MIINFSNIGGGSGGGVTTGTVQTMIDSSISGKADTSAVTEDLESKQNHYTAATYNVLTGITGVVEGDVAKVSLYEEQLPYTRNNSDCMSSLYYSDLTGKTINLSFNEDKMVEDGLTGQVITYYLICWDGEGNFPMYGIQYNGDGTYSKLTGDTAITWVSMEGKSYTFELTYPVQNIGENFSSFGIQYASHLGIVKVVYTNTDLQYNNGSWVLWDNYALMPDVQSYVEGVKSELNNQLYERQEYKYEGNVTGSPANYKDGTIVYYYDDNVEKTYETFKKADKYIERKGIYQQTMFGDGETSAVTGNEGDCYQKKTITGSSETAYTTEEFQEILLDIWNWSAGTTYKFTADTSVTVSDETYFLYTFNDGVSIGLGYKNGGWVKYENNGWVVWDGSAYVVTTPSQLTFRVYLEGNALMDVPLIVSASYVTYQYQYDTYTMMNGEWVKPDAVIELTMDEYTALTSYTKDATYVITDAEYINIDDYAKLSDVSGKADKASVTANTGRVFPRWNSQGIITGTTGDTVYQQSLNINGTSKTMLQTTNSSFGNIYAPTTAGSAAQPLLSNGSGAPVWASFKFWKGNQTAYDAITTKDNDTIYFVTDD